MAESTSADVRLTAVRALTSVVRDGKSLGELLPTVQEAMGSRESALLQELTFGTARWCYRLDSQLQQLQKKPLRNKDSDIKIALWLAMYEIEFMRTPDYAVVNSYVALPKKLRKIWAKGLVNATLREFIRRRQDNPVSDQSLSARYSLPQWLLEQIKKDWPARSEEIFNAGNSRPPLVLRVNNRHLSRDQYLPELQAALAETEIQTTVGELGRQSVVLDKSTRVTDLPGYEAGWFSVQDSAAQLAAELVDPQPAERILDACAAPGGKTCHLLESGELVEVLAIDNNARRLQRVEDNLQRLNLQAKCFCVDASDTDQWWDKNQFDAILLDAPCSAIGVLRRHPEIRLLRQPSDIQPLIAAQSRLLCSLWKTLKPGGRLIYATCSVLKSENEAQIERFLANTDDAAERPIEAQWGIPCKFGRQILPGQHGADGFYYAILVKNRHKGSA
ncbi:16S rRNA (cytosine(967)-C(5))-methyltransferase [Chromatiales bacterium (ex Bugula neritina AB1)]|nr:16S rRNA (cytosine(967)-C(5))-methyltransferase [Chromatiales bacterium (ex Bugula neritina AB1)]